MADFYVLKMRLHPMHPHAVRLCHVILHRYKICDVLTSNL